MRCRSLLAAALLAAGPVVPARAATAPIPVVAAENFHGDVAQQVGGPAVKVLSVLSNPDQAPHLFEASPSVARALAGARVVVANGVGYDPWMDKLLAATAKGERTVVVAGALTGHKAGDNPHIWYDPATMLAVAASLAEAFSAIDPPHAADFQRRLDAFRQALQPVQAKAAALRARLAGTPVTATEPVFGCMFDLLGMTSRNGAFQVAVMNGTEPAASDVAAFEADLKGHAVRLLAFNSQASSPMAARMARLARAQRIPVVGVTETEPPGKTYQEWMTGVLDAIDAALPAR